MWGRRYRYLVVVLIDREGEESIRRCVEKLGFHEHFEEGVAGVVEELPVEFLNFEVVVE